MMNVVTQKEHNEPGFMAVERQHIEIEMHNNGLQKSL